MNRAPRGYSYASPHFHKIAALIDSMVHGEVDRGRIHMPPGHAKTETVTWRLPTYWWQNVDPKAKILITCFNQTYARDLGWQIREYAKEHGVGLREDSTAKDAFRTNKGGSLMACGVGATPTGRRFDLIIGDDPIKDRKQIESQVMRDGMDQWWTQGIMSRLLPGGRVILVFTRWHEDDLGGRLEARETTGGDKYETLILPAIDDDGNALWPQVYPIEELERKMRNMLDKEGLRGWEALYQQRPTPREGAVFKPDMLQYIDASEVPDVGPVVRRWDFAASSGKGDFTSGLRGRLHKEKLVLDDLVRGQWSSEEKWAIVRATAERDGVGVTQVIPQDPGSAGKDVVAMVVRLLKGYPVKWRLETGSKEVRAEVVAPQVNIGNVRVVRAWWNGDMREELRTFPGGKHDDIVDNLSGVYQALLDYTSSFVDFGD